MSPGKPRPWKVIDVIGSSKLDMESALGMLTLERKPKKLGLKIGKIMHVLSKELYSVWLEHYTKSDKSLLGIKRATVFV